MRTIAKLSFGGSASASPFSDIVGHVRRVLSVIADRRATRPHQDLDGWSDQAEVAYYESCPVSRCL